MQTNVPNRAAGERLPETTGQSTPAERPSATSGYHRYPFYAPRFWHGMRPATWWSLLRQGRFRVHPKRLAMLFSVTFATPVNTLLCWMQRLFFFRQIRDAELHGPPVFIVGHWRSGTTLLHELLVMDERLSSPSTFQCFAPHHFLLTEWFFRRFFSWLLPGKRPMDNMATGWDRPQEDEFALMNLGLPSPYRNLAFPLQEPGDLDYLDFDGVPDRDLQVWLRKLRRFLLDVSSVTGRPLVIKSPTHTGRIAALAKAFPDARFIHVTRDPHALYPSTDRLWASLSDVQGLQMRASPRDANDGRSKRYIVECFQRMYRAFFRDRDGIEKGRIVELRYEDLIADPVENLERIYKTLHLSEFDSVRPIVEKWVQTEHRNYRVNQHQLRDEDAATIEEAWHEYFEAYGYPVRRGETASD
ncbi:MAG: sulfotransferase [Planctomycetota bacterium]